VMSFASCVRLRACHRTGVQHLGHYLVPGKGWYLHRAGGVSRLQTRSRFLIFALMAGGRPRAEPWFEHDVLSTRLDPGDGCGAAKDRWRIAFGAMCSRRADCLRLHLPRL
jgi:hypothetical protein